MILILVFLVVALGVFHYLVHYDRRGQLVNKLPGPRTLPIFGNVLSFLVPQKQLWHVKRKLNQDYYPIYRTWNFGSPFIHICHPDDAEKLLTSMKHIEKGNAYHMLQPWLGTGLLTSTGSKWQSRRKMLTPAFHFNVLVEFLDIFVEQGEGLVKHLKAEGGETVKDLVPLLTKYTLNAICETAMGTSLEDVDTKDSHYRSAVTEIGDVIVYRLFRPWLHSEKIFSATSSGVKQAKLLSTLHGFSNTIIQDRKKYHEQLVEKNLTMNGKSNEPDDDVAFVKKKRMAMLDTLIAAYRDGRQIDDEGIREEVDTFIFEGHDTTAMGMCFAVSLLAEHKDIQKHARNEVDEVLRESNGKMGMAEIQRFSYLERCIKEALRLYPSVPFVARTIRQDLQLKNFVAPAGTSVQLYIYDLHRDPSFWPNPHKFDPDRFLPDRIQGRHPYSYIPFSAGARNCIGQKFALMELKALIAHILHNFELEAIDLANEINLLTDVVIRPGQPVRVKFIPRVK
ncbi:cytochrome P450 4C1-like [Belonocnema kinseyi]|uniref:cytochrome P450 4C1-like n=1 Tax=Belonocnema kinseyi TaxID=2817044 RepID=UPI00143D4055|nr:cytochrome P450 4C1-like [Belonocnema kinseyi]